MTSLDRPLKSLHSRTFDSPPTQIRSNHNTTCTTTMADTPDMTTAVDMIEPRVDDVDIYSDAGDSGYDESLMSTASLNSSMLAYEVEHGRTYHASHAAKDLYALPNDEQEQSRLDIQYHGIRLTLEDRLFFAPIEAPTAILDIGTGTGIWAMDTADAYPGASVVGIDISPIQPRWVPPNLQFEILDANDAWGFQNDRFNLVHTRLMNGFSIRSWPHVYREAFACLKPGGWIENQEFDLHQSSDDNTIPLDGAFQEWQSLWQNGLERIGATGRCYPEVMEQQMKEAGFINVQVLKFKAPIGIWPKDKMLRAAGHFNMVAMYEGLSGISSRVFTGVLGWSVNDMELLLAGARSELTKKRIHSYWPIYVLYGQKPPT